jgi:hypothetical protein
MTGLDTAIVAVYVDVYARRKHFFWTIDAAKMLINVGHMSERFASQQKLL